jgi:hypothetical protein
MRDNTVQGGFLRPHCDSEIKRSGQSEGTSNGVAAPEPHGK